MKSLLSGLMLTLAIASALPVVASEFQAQLRPEKLTAATSPPTLSIPADGVVEKPKEVVKVLGALGHRRFIHRTTSGALVELPHRIRGCKDIRPYEEQHPIWVKTQKGFERWQHPIQGTANGANGALGVWAVYNLFHPKTK